MVTFLIGTKAQFIKLVPVVKAVNDRGRTCRIVNLGQHGRTIESLKEAFPFLSANRVEDVGSRADAQDVGALWRWARDLSRTIRAAERGGGDSAGAGVAVIHGDTLSTVMSLWYAKRRGMPVAHVEAGLRSRSLLHPFPEEIIRLYCMARSDYLFAPGPWAVDNLVRQGVKGRIFDSGGNTVVDAIRMVLDREAPAPPGEPYCLVAFHRTENIFSPRRVGKILHAVGRASQKAKVTLVLHGSTEARLRATGVYPRLASMGGVTLLPPQRYDRFLRLVDGASFVLSDGGSIQEECAALGKPCLVLRKRTERPDGIGRNAVLWGFDEATLDGFLRTYARLAVPPAPRDGASPSRVIADALLEIAGDLPRRDGFRSEAPS